MVLFFFRLRSSSQQQSTNLRYPTRISTRIIITLPPSLQNQPHMHTLAQLPPCSRTCVSLATSSHQTALPSRLGLGLPQQSPSRPTRRCITICSSSSSHEHVSTTGRDHKTCSVLAADAQQSRPTKWQWASSMHESLSSHTTKLLGLAALLPAGLFGMGGWVCTVYTH